MGTVLVDLFHRLLGGIHALVGQPDQAVALVELDRPGLYQTDAEGDVTDLLGQRIGQPLQVDVSGLFLVAVGQDQAELVPAVTETAILRS